MIWRAFRMAKGTQTTCGSGERRFLMVVASDDFQLFPALPGAAGAAVFPGGEIIPHSLCWSAKESSGVNERCNVTEGGTCSSSRGSYTGAPAFPADNTCTSNPN